MDIRILPAPTVAVKTLVDAHVTFCDRTAPAESCHRLPVSALFAPDITVWGAFEDTTLVGMGALKQFSGTDGEIKSMHTSAAWRGKGVARAILKTIIGRARDRGLTALWLETGVHPDFAPATALYRAHGFTDTGPFGPYVADLHSLFLTLDLTTTEAPA